MKLGEGEIVLISAVMAKPVSSICTLIRGGKFLLIIRFGLKAVGRNLPLLYPLMAILILLISACGYYLFLVVKQGFTLPLDGQ